MKALRPILFTLLRRGSVHIALAGSITALLSLPSTHAASAVYGSAGTSTNWSDPSNWGGNAAPGAFGTTNNADIATFNVPPVVGAGDSLTNALVIDPGWNIKGITFDTNAGSFFIGSPGGNALTLSSGGSIQILSTMTTTGATETIDAPLTLEGAYTFTNAATGAGDSFAFGGNITQAVTGTLTINGAGTGSNTISGNLLDGAGVLSLTISASAGRWTLSGTNNYSGTTLISGATTVVFSGTNSSTTGQTRMNNNGETVILNNSNNGGLAGGQFNFFGGVLQSGVPNLVLSNTVDNQGNVVVSGTNSITFNGSWTNDLGNRQLNSSIVGGTLTLAGNVYLSESTAIGRTWTITGAGNTVISGVIANANGAPGTAGNLVIGGNAGGTTTLSNPNNSYTGTTTISTNTLRVTTLANGGSNSSIGASSNAATNLVFTTLVGINPTLQYTGETVITDRAFTLNVNTTAIIDVTNAAANLTMVGDTGSVISGQALTKNGPGTLTLTGAQTYAGATTVNGGTLVLDMNAGGSFTSTSIPTLAGGALQIKGANNVTSTQTLGNLTLAANTNNAIKLSSTGGSGGMTLTLGNTWTRATGSTLNIDLSAANTTLTSQPVTSTASQTVTSGIVVYTTVTDSGGTGLATVVNNNIVRYTAAGTLQSTSDGSTSNFVTKVGDAGYSGNTLTLTNANHRMVSLQLDTSAGSGVLDLNGNTTTALGGALLVTGSNDFTIQNGLVGITASGGREEIIHQFGTGTLTISATMGVSTNTMSVTKDGPGTLVFTAANPYTGTTAINGGVFRAVDGIGLPTTSPLVLNNGVFETSAATFTRALGAANGNVRITGGLSGFSANGGAVTVALGGVGSPTPLTWGSANFNPGTLVLNESTANNTLDFKNAIDLAGSTRTINVNAASANTATISGVINSSLPGGAIVKGGVGTLILSNVNTYTGATTISSGEVVVSGSLNGTTAVKVANGATLASGASGGSITTGATSGTAIDIAGILSPGDANIAPITLTLAVGTKLNFDSGSTLRLDVASNGSSDSVIFGGSASDWLSGSGNVTLSLNGSIDYSSTYVIFQNVSTPGFNFAGITGYDTANWKANVVQSGNNYDLTFSAIPEPGSLASLVGGLGLLVGLQRRHRRRA